MRQSIGIQWRAILLSGFVAVLAPLSPGGTARAAALEVSVAHPIACRKVAVSAAFGTVETSDHATLMTMAADVLGFLPLAVGIGHGTDLLKPLAVAVMGGLCLAILASLLLMPMLFLLLRPGEEQPVREAW